MTQFFPRNMNDAHTAGGKTRMNVNVNNFLNLLGALFFQRSTCTSFVLSGCFCVPRNLLKFCSYQISTVPKYVRINKCSSETPLATLRIPVNHHSANNDASRYRHHTAAQQLGVCSNNINFLWSSHDAGDGRCGRRQVCMNLKYSARRWQNSRFTVT